MKNPKVVMAVILSLSMSQAFSQNLELTSSSGGYDEGSNGSVSWSIGEPIVETYEGSSMNVTQGFHQPDIHVVSVSNFQDIEISVYPNPTSDLININSEEQLNIRVFDAAGREVMSTTTNNTSNQIDLSDLSRGAYTFVFESNESIVKTVKIIKQ